MTFDIQKLYHYQVYDSLWPKLELDFGYEKYNTEKSIITNSETESVIEIVMPGIPRENIYVTTKDRKVFVEVKVKDNNKLSKLSAKERKYTFLISDKADSTNISSKYENGILKITIPLKDKSEGEFEIKVE